MELSCAYRPSTTLPTTPATTPTTSPANILETSLPNTLTSIPPKPPVTPFTTPAATPYSPPSNNVNLTTKALPAPSVSVSLNELLNPSPGSGVNLLHLELLYHMFTVTYSTFRPDTDISGQDKDVAMKYALSAPSLMHQLLAISALHLSTLRPQQRDFYRSLATELQTSGLTLFNNLPGVYVSENPEQALLYSSFLGIQVQYETLLYRPTDFSHFVEQFVNYLRLHRGVYTIVKGSWMRIKESNIGALMSSGNTEHDPVNPGLECETLRSLLPLADLSQRSIEACQEAVKHLQWIFDSMGAKNTRNHGGTDLIFAWPIMISPEFTDLLMQCRPEALAILAHYAVLIDRRRYLWIINDGGRYLISAITRHLGSYWQQWLALPNSVLLENVSRE